MTVREFRNNALSFPGVKEVTHFDRIAFKVYKKRIFATLHDESAMANVKLPLSDQEVFCAINKDAIYIVPNKWGEQGWTTFVLKDLPGNQVLDALNTAYKDVFAEK